jgi:two-component system LytT family sensor kinase
MNRLKVFWDKSFTDWRYRLALHFGFWFAYLVFWLRESMVVHITFDQHFLVTLTGIAFSLFLYYPLVYLIVPVFKKQQWFLGVLLMVVYYIIAVTLRAYHISLIIQWYNLHNASVAGADFWDNLYQKQLNPVKLFQVIFSGLTSLITIIFVPLTIKFIRYAYQFSQQQMWLAKENAELKLNTLKAQVNPHFFFNTLNNLQSFIVQKEQEKSVDLLNRLADFMRSSLYDCEKEYITLAQEVNLLQNYIAIEKVRFEENANIVINFDINDGAYQIPPFIFLAFIENAFKHGGVVTAEDVCITIELIECGDKITLNATNNFILTEDKDQKGIGLANVRKRLNHYFPNHYTLILKEEKDMFTVKLELYK